MESLFPPKKGASVGITRYGKGTKLMAIPQKRGRPVSVLIASASRHEVVLVQPTLDACIVSEMPAILIGDRAYDSDPLDASLRQRGIEMVVPDKKKSQASCDARGSSSTSVQASFSSGAFFLLGGRFSSFSSSLGVSCCELFGFCSPCLLTYVT